MLLKGPFLLTRACACVSVRCDFCAVCALRLLSVLVVLAARGKRFRLSAGTQVQPFLSLFFEGQSPRQRANAWCLDPGSPGDFKDWRCPCEEGQASR